MWKWGFCLLVLTTNNDVQQLVGGTNVGRRKSRITHLPFAGAKSAKFPASSQSSTIHFCVFFWCFVIIPFIWVCITNGTVNCETNFSRPNRMQEYAECNIRCACLRFYGYFDNSNGIVGLMRRERINGYLIQFTRDSRWNKTDFVGNFRAHQREMEMAMQQYAYFISAETCKCCIIHARTNQWNGVGERETEKMNWKCLVSLSSSHHRPFSLKSKQ